jgi:hypothetical protein
LGLNKVADEKAFPETPDNVTLATGKDPETYFIKRPRIHCLPSEHQAIPVPQTHLDEVYTLGFLKQNLHPNIVSYHGCKVNRGRITGIVLTRLPKILDHRSLHDASDFDEQVF